MHGRATALAAGLRAAGVSLRHEAFFDTVTAEVTVTAVREDKPIVTLATVVRTSAGEVAVTGEATVLVQG